MIDQPGCVSFSVLPCTDGVACTIDKEGERVAVTGLGRSWWIAGDEVPAEIDVGSCNEGLVLRPFPLNTRRQNGTGLDPEGTEWTCADTGGVAKSRGTSFSTIPLQLGHTLI